MPYTKTLLLVNVRDATYILSVAFHLKRYVKHGYQRDILNGKKMAQKNKIARVIVDTLADDFENVKILDVKIDKDVDVDGVEFLRVQIVFEGARKDVDAKKIAGAVRQVRPKLREMGELAFPLFSFISQGDVNAGGLAPA